MKNINIVSRVTPTELETAFIETLIFYTCLDSYSEAYDRNGYLFQKTKEGAKFIHDVAEILWKIAEQDEHFEKRVNEYEQLLKQVKHNSNEALTILTVNRVNNFRTVNRHATGGDNYKS